ncbi:hypothetical protein DFH07DRAFT_766241 [Mycena maculata]|uniref:Uncharacterized protein n=1 Tax=Mycena maculata TaxID=230809 RepID=A0AAD7K8Q1_9AGAR|nr:hypothetical protein DFH07DRAFT_766241 [Mycena maculata]
MTEIITLETNKRFHVSKWIGHAILQQWEHWQALTMQVVHWILEDGGSDDCLDEEDDYEEPDEGGGTKKHPLKAPHGGVNKDRKNLKKPAKVCKQPAKKAPAVKAKNRAKL